MLTCLAIGLPGPEEMIVICIIGVILFGKRLPEVGRSLGKGIVEFKKGLKGIEDEVESASNASKPPQAQNLMPAQQAPQQIYQQTAPAPQIAPPLNAGQARFDPYTGKPLRFDPVTGQPLEQPVETAAGSSNQIGA
jgi:sec-independent protein translocase protein TatA